MVDPASSPFVTSFNTNNITSLSPPTRDVGLDQLEGVSAGEERRSRGRMEIRGETHVAGYPTGALQL
jgi:hypothetical protein